MVTLHDGHVNDVPVMVCFLVWHVEGSRLRMGVIAGGKTPDVESAKRSSWHKQYNSRESSSKAYTGRYYEDDTMYGHTETIRGVRFQPTLDLIASCSADRTVRCASNVDSSVGMR
jgi:WD40 repeat protein